MPYKEEKKKRDYQHNYCKAHPEKYKYTEHKKNLEKANNAMRKQEVFLFYANGTIQCAFCGMSDLDVLCIDHVHNNGRKHRRAIGNKRGSAFYRWLQQNNYPDGFQVLCANCNQKKEVLRRRNGE